MKNNWIALSIFSFGICFLIGSWLISSSLEKQSPKVINQIKEKQLMTESEVADYLGVSIKEVQKLTKFNVSPDGYNSDIPNLTIENKVYYPKKAVDKWLVNIQLTNIP